MARRKRVSTRVKFNRLLSREQSAVRRHDFKKAIKLNEKGAKLIRVLEHRRLKRMK